jgi:hypothetical protein
MKNIQTKPKNCLPDWQLNKIRTIIENRWDEVWQTVVEREEKLSVRRFEPKLLSSLKF